MKNHLSSTDIQRLLGQEINEEEKRHFNLHLEICTDCQQEVESFRKIFLGLTTEEKILLPEQFTQEVLSQLTPLSYHQKNTRWNEIILAFAGIVLALAVSIYYSGTEFLLLLFKEFGKMGQGLQSPALQVDFSFIDKLFNPYTVAVMGILAIIVVLDRVLLNKRVVHFM